MHKKITFFFSLFNLVIELANAQTPQLWGTTPEGGSLHSGTVFTINGDGSGYQVAISLSSPTGTLVKSGDNILNGTCQSGGAKSMGFMFAVLTLNETDTDLYDFKSDTCFYPVGSLVIDNGIFYGYTSEGGLENHGVIYSFNPSTDTLTVLYNFNDTTGGDPTAGGLTLATDGTLYGVTNSDGASNSGVLFNLNLSDNTYTDVHNFGGKQGANPFGRVIEVNGIIYGTAASGGASGAGVIYSYDPATSTYTDRYDFSRLDGIAPFGDLVYYNGLLYGMAYSGGVNGDGLIFSYNISNNTFSDLHDFDETDGANPNGGLCLASDSKLYGVTATGGTYNSGVIFKYDETDSVFTSMYTFGVTDTDAGKPTADLIDLLGAPAGINTMAAETDFSVYPNPTSNQFTVESGQLTVNEITVTNVLGQIVYKSFPNENKVTVDIKDAGIYFVSVISGGATATRKLVVAK